MKCSEIKYQLSEYIDGLQNEEQLRNIEVHLQKCSKCRNDLQYLKNYKSLINKLDNQKAPADLESKIFNKIDSGNEIFAINSKKQNPRISLIIKLTGIAAAILVFIYFVNPIELFSPASLSVEFVPKMEKKGKDEKMKKGSLNEYRTNQAILKLTELVEAHKGEILKENIEADEIFLLIIIPKANYYDFAESFNLISVKEKLPNQLPFSFSRKVRIQIGFIITEL